MKVIKYKHRKKFIGFLFVSPWLVGFLVFTAYPLLTTLFYSFCNVRFFLVGIGTEPEGMQNYAKVLLNDPALKLAIPDYITQLVFIVPMVLVFSILLSLLLNNKFKFRRWFRALFFLPVIIMSGPVVTNLKVMGATELSGVKSFFVYRFISGHLPSVISTPLLYTFDNAVVILWFCGVQILIILSALQKVDRNIYEAAEVDGATKWQQFWKITMPIIKPFVFLCSIYTIVDVSMSALNPIIVLIKEGMFQPTKGFGFSAAISWIYFLIILLAVLIAYLLLGRERKDKLHK
jgi:ABC-type sugar transport system permease subunit